MEISWVNNSLFSGTDTLWVPKEFATIVLFQLPLNSMLLNLMDTGRFLLAPKTLNLINALQFLVSQSLGIGSVTFESALDQT